MVANELVRVIADKIKIEHLFKKFVVEFKFKFYQVKYGLVKLNVAV